MSSAFLFKVMNEDSSDLHKVWHAPILKLDVGKEQLHFDVSLLSLEAVQRDFDSRKELAHLIGLICHTSVIAMNQFDTIKFLPDGPAALHLSTASSALLALPLSFDSLLKSAMLRFFDACLSLSQMSFKDIEQNIRVMYL